MKALGNSATIMESPAKAEASCASFSLNTTSNGTADVQTNSCNNFSSCINPSKRITNIQCYVLKPNTDDAYDYYKDVINCRTCLEEIELGRGYPITETHEGRTLKEMIVLCVPQMASTLDDSEIVCSTCLENIKFCAYFIESCLYVEEKLKENCWDDIPENSVNGYYYEGGEQVPNEEYEVYPMEEDEAYPVEEDGAYPIQETEECLIEEYETHPINEEDVDAYFVEGDEAYQIEGDEAYPVEGDEVQTCIEDQESVSDINQKISLDHSYQTNELLEPYQQTSVQEEFTQKNSEANINNSSTSRHECLICVRTFRTKNFLLNHIRLMHSREGYPDLGQELCVFKCEFCEKTFLTKVGCDQHLQANHREHFSSGSGQQNHRDEMGSSVVSCHLCGKGFKTAGALNFHARSHNSKRPNSAIFKCTKCSTCFQQKAWLNSHMKQCHPKTKDFACFICDEMFAYKDNWKAHNRFMHSGVTSVECEHCGNTFNKTDYLESHVNSNECNINQAPLKKRRYVYKTETQGVSMCSLCFKVFNNAQALRLHTKTHIQHRKFKCSVCNLRFPNSSKKDRHEKEHGDVLGSYTGEVCFRRESQDDPDEHRTLRNVGSNKFECYACGKLFSRKYLLHNHLSEKHWKIVEDSPKDQDI
ncbi:hypothetical protein NQ315_012341 [Exocentrus adspersus]|uniref:C2H2-type domain-containing protein n=1 Tax=Exocentrus adspersus TaxID=1586481 RepID=A0AAV8V8J4_9CUCU|nr:hypothetical protein NQ315_012341 [Exocentrus adspersus]